MRTAARSLVCVAHGTRHGPGNAVALDLARQAGSLLGVPAAAAYAELCAPAFADVAAAQVDRLREAGASPGRPVMVVAGGSRDPLALPDLHAPRELLADAWGAPVALAALSGPLPRPAGVLTPEHVVSPYLLAPGLFADRARREGAPALVADVIAAHPSAARLVAERWVDDQRKSMSRVPLPPTASSASRPGSPSATGWSLTRAR